MPFEYYNSGGSEGARHSCRFIERFVRTVYSKRARLLIAEVKRHECRAPSDNIALTPLRLAWIGCLLSSVWLLPLFALAQTNTNLALDQIPPLRPPRAEIPPGFWEQHSSAVLAVVLVLLFGIGIGLWLLFRRGPQATIPPAIQARQVLNPLLGQPENGSVLSCVSQTLRGYMTGAFGFAPGELTTTEFCELISANSSVGSGLSSEIAQFLRSCDQRKFAPAQNGSSLNAVATALKFVEQSEQRCAELRKAEQNSEAQSMPASKDGRSTS